MSSIVRKAPAFSDVEKLALANIINDYKSVIENKSTDGVSSQLKKTAWAEVESKFNARVGVMKRDVSQLKKLVNFMIIIYSCITSPRSRGSN